MRHALLSTACFMFGVLGASAPASAQEFSELGRGFTPDRASQVDISGALRLRGELLHNLDLDHGLTPSGLPLYPVPLADPEGQLLSHSDMRLRTDVSAYAPNGTVRVNMRVDIIDNLTLGSTPLGTPISTTTQDAPSGSVFRLKRAWGEALTPFGVIAAGRMGNTWGLGMAANGGDCLDCDSGDAADRIAFVTSRRNHFVAVAYDIGWVGETAPRRAGARVVDIERSDNVSTFTAAILRQRDQLALERRAAADKVTFDYGLVYSYRRQKNDVPVTYVPTTEPVDIDAQQVIARDYRASLVDAWVRLSGPSMRIEAEAALVRAYIGEASLIPGVRFDAPLTSLQYGFALETEFGDPNSRFTAGVDMGAASGDAAYGFGAYPGAGAGVGEPGDLEGAQINPPYDTALDNFTFHPDYRVDQILFREIIGTVTDAIYLRPHMRWDVLRATPGKLTLRLAANASRSVFASSTPGGKTPLGVELDPSLDYINRDGLNIGVDYAVLFPLAGLDNVRDDLPAKPAQLARLRLRYAF